MRRVILLFAAVLLASVGWSQTMTITLEDGSTVKYNMNKVKSIDFTSDDSGTNQDATHMIVGTWQHVHGEGWGMENQADGELPILQINADGTYIFLDKKKEEIKVEHGKWTMVDNHFYRQITEGKYRGTVWDYSILNLTSESFQISNLGFIGTYKKVSDSILEKYADVIANYDIGEVVFDVNGRAAYEEHNYKDEARFSTSNTVGSSFHFNSPSLSDPYKTFSYYFPIDKYGRLSASYFYVGFSDFSNIMFKIGNAAKVGDTVYGEYVSGNAVVVENDGVYIGIRFDNFKCSAVIEGERYYITIVSGVIKFKI